MMEWMPIIFAAFGSVALACEAWVARLNRRTFRRLRKRVRITYVTSTSLIGILLVTGSLYPQYHVRSDLRIFGVPFMTAAFQFERVHWIDYTGFLTLPALIGNAAVAFLLPQLVVAGLWRITRVSR